MSELTDSLRTHGLQHKGTHLGGLLQWAALHIESQDQALADLRGAGWDLQDAAEALRASIKDKT